MADGYPELRNERVTAANGVDYANRDTGYGQETPTRWRRPNEPPGTPTYTTQCGRCLS